MTNAERLALYESTLGTVLVGLSDLLDQAEAAQDDYVYGCASVAAQPVKFLYERIKAAQLLSEPSPDEPDPTAPVEETNGPDA